MTDNPNYPALSLAYRDQDQMEDLFPGTGISTRPSGGGGTTAKRSQFADLMGMPWATPKEIVLAIPPVYTEWIGARL